MADSTTRLCGFCLTQVPLAELYGGTQCADRDACEARAKAKYLYPLSEDRDGQAIEMALASRAAGTPPARQAAPQAEQPAKRDAWPEHLVRDFPELAGQKVSAL